MNILFFLIPMALLLGGSFVYAFVWAVRHHQYDKTETEAIRILIDDVPEKNQPPG